MLNYPSQEAHRKSFIPKAQAKYYDGLRKAGLEPNETLNRAMDERIWQEAKEDFEEQQVKVLLHNLDMINAQPYRYTLREDCVIPTVAMCCFIIMASLTWWCRHWPESALLCTLSAFYFAGILVYRLYRVWKDGKQESINVMSSRHAA